MKGENSMKKETLLVLLCAFLNLTMWAQIQDEQKIVSDERTEDAQFGSEVDIFLNYAIVGESLNDTDENLGNTLEDAGAAYIYKKDSEGNWIKQQKLVAPDRETDGNFGIDVAIYDTIVLIGSDKNKVYVFEKNVENVWIHKQTLSETGTQSYGLHLSIYDNYAIIGDHYGWGTFSGGYQYPAGAAYIYEKDESGIWSKKTKIMASDYSTYDNFGFSVDIYKDYAIVGNSKHNNNRGSAYLFHRSSEGAWSETQKIEASDLEVGDIYGETVAIDDSVVVVGSRGESYDAEGSNYIASSGAVYVYKINSDNSCTLSEKVVAPVRDTKWAYFGNSIDLNSNYLIVGSYKEEEDSNNENTLTDAGATYVFEKNSSGKWSFSLKVTPTDRVESDLFGNSVAVYNANFIVGAPQGDFNSDSEDSISNAGCSYIYELQTTPSIAIQPIEQNSACIGSETSFSVVGSRIENYQWQVSSNGGDTWTDVTDNDIYSGATTAILVVKASSDLNNNQYFCAVSNSNGDLNSDTVSLMVSIDAEAPTITSTHNSQTLDGGSSCEVSLPDYTGDVVAEDNCDLELEITQSPAAGSSISGSSNTVTLTATDDAGNYSEYSFYVSVEDNTNPLITSSHSNKTIEAETNCEVSLPDYTGDVTATDICDAELEVTQSPIAGTKISGTTNNITLTVTDDAGNTDYVTFNVTIEDNTNPTVTCPTNKTVSLSNGQTAYSVTGTELDPIAIEDNCEISLLINSFNDLTTLNGAELTAGTHSIIWQATDDAGNANTCTFDVTVNEATTSITELQQRGISIYPNPTNGIVNFEWINDNVQSIVISDISGKHIIEINNIHSQKSIDLSELINGVYVVSILTNDKVYTTRIIKE